MGERIKQGKQNAPKKKAAQSSIRKGDGRSRGEIPQGDFGFYEMVRYWVRSDHYNPTIRCEIIWDMLLSGFVCDLMRAHCENAGDVRLLAKEFPYGKTAYDDKTGELKGSKADYLVGVDDCLYFVELKTDTASFRKDQYENYMNYVRPKEEGFRVGSLWKRYREIIKKAGGENHYQNSGSGKYRYQVEQLKRACGADPAMDNDAFFESDFIGRYKKIGLAYLTFDRIKAPRGIDQEELDRIQIVISDLFGKNSIEVFGNGRKRKQWLLVEEIIKETMKGEMTEGYRS